MTARAIVLVDESDRKIGKTVVPETVFVIRHGESMFVRTAEGVRLRGGGIGIVFRATEVFVRERLDPA